MTVPVSGEGFSLRPPVAWEVVDRPVGGMPVLALEADRDGRSRVNATVVVAPVGGLDFTPWQRGCDELLSRTLTDWLLLDLTRLTVDGREAVRRLGHHRSTDGAAVTMEQWAVLDGDTGLTLTLSVETSAYDAPADLVAGIGESLRLTGTPT